MDSGRAGGIADALTSDRLFGGTISDGFGNRTEHIGRVLRLRLRRALRANPYDRPKTAAILQFRVRPNGTSTVRLVRTSDISVLDKRVLNVARGIKAPKPGGTTAVSVRIVVQ